MFRLFGGDKIFKRVVECIELNCKCNWIGRIERENRCISKVDVNK